MTRHRTITSFVAVALLAVAATAATLRPLPSKNHPNASAGIMSLSELKADANKLAMDLRRPIVGLFGEAPLAACPAACAGCVARRH